MEFLQEELLISGFFGEQHLQKNMQAKNDLIFLQKKLWQQFEEHNPISE